MAHKIDRLPAPHKEEEEEEHNILFISLIPTMVLPRAVLSLLAVLLLQSTVVSGFLIANQNLQQRSTAWKTSISSVGNNDSDASFVSTVVQDKSIAKSLKGSTLVVKYGGNAMTSEELKDLFCEDVAALQSLGVRVTVVHGGGPQINAMLEQVGVESRFENGMRVSSPEVVRVAEMVLCGSVNKEISSKICGKGGRAVGVSGRDDSLLQCTKQEGKGGVDIGFVGKVETVNSDVLCTMLDNGICPVVSPIGCGMEDEYSVAFNVNADVAAGKVAGALSADRLIFLTDIAGVLNKEMDLIPALTVKDVDDLIEDETITGGMIPKVSFATDAVKSKRVKSAFITDGRVPHALLKEMIGQSGGGTVVTL